MRIDIATLRSSYVKAQRGKRSRHSVDDRTRPSIFQYDYLTLRALSEDMRSLVAELPDGAPSSVALDLGSDKSPYRDLLEERGYSLRTLDITTETGADFQGTAESTNLPDATFDVVVCTQVLEHCQNPWVAVREIQRILKPRGYLIVSVPHVWFYHPHPADNWRFTQEGVIQLCREGGLEPRVLLAQGGSVAALAQITNFLAYGLMGRAGAPLFLLTNVIGRLLDRVVQNSLFCLNFACLAERQA